MNEDARTYLQAEITNGLKEMTLHEFTTHRMDNLLPGDVFGNWADGSAFGVDTVEGDRVLVVWGFGDKYGEKEWVSLEWLKVWMKYSTSVRWREQFMYNKSTGETYEGFAP